MIRGNAHKQTNEVVLDRAWVANLRAAIKERYKVREHQIAGTARACIHPLVYGYWTVKVSRKDGQSADIVTSLGNGLQLQTTKEAAMRIADIMNNWELKA